MVDNIPDFHNQRQSKYSHEIQKLWMASTPINMIIEKYENLEFTSLSRSKWAWRCYVLKFGIKVVHGKVGFLTSSIY